MPVERLLPLLFHTWIDLWIGALAIELHSNCVQ
jgi:hypothetical protein